MEPRPVVSRALVGGLCVSAAVAVIALLSGSFDEVHWRVIGTSLGFSVFTSTAAAGASLRSRSDGRLRLLGNLTVGTSLAALAMLVAALWIEDREWLWRGFGIAALGALWSSHASLTLAALRPGDSPAIRRLSAISALTLGMETSVGVLVLLEAITEVNDAGARVLAALIVVTVLSTVLPPILRRTGRQEPSTAATAVGRADGFAAEVEQSALRLAAMDLPAHARAEVEYLRRLARDAGA